MKNKIFLFLGIIFLASTLCIFAQENKKSNRVYFTIDPEDRQFIIPVQLGDSITVKLVFDTGWRDANSPVYLDSGILATYPNLSQNIVPDTTQVGSSWGTARERTLTYDCNTQLNIGNTSLAYDGICVMNWKRHTNCGLSDGIFNMPRNDTTHVWELNFENNYMEIHPANNFSMPEDCYTTPLIGPDYGPFFINLPMHIKSADNDTLTINRPFFIDTGMPWDIVFIHTAEEFDFFNKKKDAVWTKYINNYHRYYNVEASLFNDFKIDSLRIYTFDYLNNFASTPMIGFNFLKRFNVFFDMKNKQLGLQPISNFQRVVNPLYKRFHYSTEKTPDGKFIVKIVADCKANYYKAAGLQVGDEITAINDVPYVDINSEMAEKFMKMDTIKMNIIRNRKSISLPVKIDHNEQQGD